VEYSSRLEWQDIGDNIPRDLNFREHTYWQVELWYGPHGENAGRTTRFTRQQPGGQVLGASVAPARFWVPHEWAAVNPATLPPSPAELRVLLLRLGQPRGYLSRQLVTYSEGLMLMENEPLPPAVRAGILRVIASIAAHPSRGTRFVVLGTATDLAGRTGIALGVEQANNPGPGFQYLTTWIFDPRTGALLDTADAGCKIKLGTIPEVQGDCVPYDYTQYTKATAVPAFPGFPVTPKDWGDVVW